MLLKFIEAFDVFEVVIADEFVEVNYLLVEFEFVKDVEIVEFKEAVKVVESAKMLDVVDFWFGYQASFLPEVTAELINDKHSS